MISGILGYAVYLFCDLIVTLIVVEAIMSWFVMAMPNSIRRIYGLLQTLTEPFLRPFRALFSKLTYSVGIDISPIFAIIAIQFIGRTVYLVLAGMHF